MSPYTHRLAFDDVLRNAPRWPSVGIDDFPVQQLREAIAGKADNAVLAELVGHQIERFCAARNLDAAPGSDEWRVIARALCSAAPKALERLAERDEGDFSGIPSAPIIKNAQPATTPLRRSAFRSPGASMSKLGRRRVSCEAEQHAKIRS
ncbi:hypothetical protein [Roseovarius sp. D22-M7]|uniref:hypothetical protein n=1 Tax=Roseovarius sp. D22-M7 TaxID=3127116 RepID=UPI0030100A01